MTPWAALLAVWAASAAVMLAGWRWQHRHANAGIADVLWSASLAGSAIFLAAVGPGAALTRVALALFGGVWGLSLARRLWTRVRGEPEDGRYAWLRRTWSARPLPWAAMFQAQALAVALFSTPFLAVAWNRSAQPAVLGAGGAVWLAAVLCERLADRQLARFRADPAHRRVACRQGMWRYSRHPNYFFEWLGWFAYVLLARGSPLAPLAWVGPAAMFVFLRWLSGIPFTEAQALRTRGEDYRDYQRSTPMFFPWLPKRASRTRTGS